MDKGKWGGGLQKQLKWCQVLLVLSSCVEKHSHLCFTGRTNWKNYSQTTIERYNMKYYVSISTFLSLALVITASTVLAGQGPETIDLKATYKVEGKKSAVIFSHHAHQENLECSKCHKSSAGGGPLVVEIVKLTTTKNDFHKKFCWPCHVEMKVPKGKSCKTCHPK